MVQCDCILLSSAHLLRERVCSIFAYTGGGGIFRMSYLFTGGAHFFVVRHDFPCTVSDVHRAELASTGGKPWRLLAKKTSRVHQWQQLSSQVPSGRPSSGTTSSSMARWRRWSFRQSSFLRRTKLLARCSRSSHFWSVLWPVLLGERSSGTWGIASAGNPH